MPNAHDSSDLTISYLFFIFKRSVDNRIFTPRGEVNSGFLSWQVYRHGDRSPTHIYPNDPYQEDVWPQGIGMLTQVSAGNIFSLII